MTQQRDVTSESQEVAEKGGGGADGQVGTNTSSGQPASSASSSSSSSSTNKRKRRRGRKGKKAKQSAEMGQEQEKSGKDQQQAEEDGALWLRRMIEEIVRGRRSLVVHNGLLDLIFVYHYFIGKLPSSLQSFVNHICALFPRLYDTKYIADYHITDNASYLEYLYHKCERNSPSSLALYREGALRCLVRIPRPLLQAFAKEEAADKKKEDESCPQYMYHGYCPHGNSCKLSHDIELILDKEEGVTTPRSSSSSSNSRSREGNAKRQKRDQKQPDLSDDTSSNIFSNNFSLNNFSSNNFSSNISSSSSSNSSKETQQQHSSTFGQQGDEANNPPVCPMDIPHLHVGKMHSAGYDAFCTGFVYSHLLLKLGAERMHSYGNKLYLIAKQHPLLLEKSRYK